MKNYEKWKRARDSTREAKNWMLNGMKNDIDTGLPFVLSVILDKNAVAYLGRSDVSGSGTNEIPDCFIDALEQSIVNNKDRLLRDALALMRQEQNQLKDSVRLEASDILAEVGNSAGEIE